MRVHPRRLRHVAVLLTVSLAAGCGLVVGVWAQQRPLPPVGCHPAPCTPPTPPTESPPPPTSTPTLPPGKDPVVVHDCDLGAGYEVGQWVRPSPAPAGEPEVHVISVYQTSDEHSFRYHPTGGADVYVHRTGRPLVLVFSAYEPTLWRVHADPGVDLDRVVLYGYHPQKLQRVPDDTKVVDRVGDVDLPYEPSAKVSPPTFLAEDAGAPVTSWTGCYDASVFSVR